MVSKGAPASGADSISKGNARCTGPGVPPSAFDTALDIAGNMSRGQVGRTEILVMGLVILI